MCRGTITAERFGLKETANLYDVSYTHLYTSGATITVSIIGTDWEPHREVKISNTSSTSGKNTVVHSTRYVYANGELISTDTLNTSTYMPHEP